jgi:hypothetical protein
MRPGVYRMIHGVKLREMGVSLSVAHHDHTFISSLLINDFADMMNVAILQHDLRKARPPRQLP